MSQRMTSRQRKRTNAERKDQEIIQLSEALKKARRNMNSIGASVEATFDTLIKTNFDFQESGYK